MQYTQHVRLLRNGQITIPADFRKALGLDQAPVLQVTLDVDEIRIRPYDPDKLETGSDWLRDLYLLLEPARQGAECLPEELINRAFDVALDSVRNG